MDNFYRPPGGHPGDHQPTEQFWRGQGTPPGSQGPGSQQQPGLQAHMTKDRRKAWHWTVGITLAALLAGGGVITGASLAGSSLSTTPTASTGTASTGTASTGAASTGTASTGTASTGGTGSGSTGSGGTGTASTGSGGTGSQAAMLDATLNAAGSPDAAVTTTAAAATGAAVPAAAPGAGAGPAGTGAALAGAGARRCVRAVRAARAARLAGHPRLARRAAGAAGVRCRFIRRRIVRFFLLRGVDGQFTFRTRTGAIRTLAYERGVIESVNGGSSIVVKAADGTTWPWDLISSTVVRDQGGKVSESTLAVGEAVWVGGPVVSGAKDARLIFVRPPSG